MPPCSDRKSTRLNSSHLVISYAVFCLKKRKMETSEHSENAKDLIPDALARQGVGADQLTFHADRRTSIPSKTVAQLFFFNDTATTEIYTLSLHDALPIWCLWPRSRAWWWQSRHSWSSTSPTDWKSTRLNSSHLVISYAVFCLKKKI